VPLVQLLLQHSLLPVQDAPFDRHAAHSRAAVAEAAAALTVLLAPFLHRFPLRLQPGGEAALTDTDEGCQRVPYEGCSHQPKRLSSREGVAR
jgi:hypothetical protein